MNESLFNTTTPQQEIAAAAARKKAFEDGSKNRVPELYIKDGETATIRIFGMNNPQDEYVTFYEHSLKDPMAFGGKGGFVNFTCLRGNCPLCGVGDKATYKGAFLVLHIDNVETDEHGNSRVLPKFKLWKAGINVLKSLEAIRNPKKNAAGQVIPGTALSSQNVQITRSGQGLNTTYTIMLTNDVTLPAYDSAQAFSVPAKLTPDAGKLADMQNLAARYDKKVMKGSDSSAQTTSSANTNNLSVPAAPIAQAAPVNVAPPIVPTAQVNATTAPIAQVVFPPANVVTKPAIQTQAAPVVPAAPYIAPGESWENTSGVVVPNPGNIATLPNATDEFKPSW